MHWIILNNIDQLDKIKDQSSITPQLIFKHSTKCPISSMAKHRLERATAPVGIDCYFLDLIAYRAISNAVADMCGVTHESPQVLLLKNKICVYHESHNGITMEEIEKR
jgi:bacillithiol system protein YtxJ